MLYNWKPYCPQTKPLLWRHITPYYDELDVLSTYSVDRLLTLLFFTSSKKWVGKAQRIPELDEREWCNSTHPQIFPLEIFAGISCTTQEPTIWAENLTQKKA